MLNILLLSFIVVMIIDVSGFVDELKSVIKSILTNGKMSDPNYSLKPFDCSLCMTFWTGIVYLLIINNLTLFNITFTLFIAVMTPVIRDLIFMIREIMTYIIRKIDEKL